MRLLAAALRFLYGCAPVTAQPAKVYDQLGLNTADHVDLLAPASPTPSPNFRVFFQTFSQAFETDWPQYCRDVQCLSHQWQISLQEVDAKTFLIKLDEINGKNHTSVMRKFPYYNIAAVTHFAKQTVRMIITCLSRFPPTRGNDRLPPKREPCVKQYGPHCMIPLSQRFNVTAVEGNRPAMTSTSISFGEAKKLVLRPIGQGSL